LSSEHLASLEPCQSAFEIGEFHLGVDYRKHAAGHLGEAVANVAHRGPNEPKVRYCCWNSCIRLKFMVGPDVAPQVTSRPPRLSAAIR